MFAAGAGSQVSRRRRSARGNSAAASERITGIVRARPDPFPAMLVDAAAELPLAVLQQSDPLLGVCSLANERDQSIVSGVTYLSMDAGTANQ